MEIFVCFHGIEHLEHAVQAWKPRLEGDIDRIERVQRRATIISFGFEKLEYEERLKRFNLTKLKDRRVRGDLIEIFKVISSRDSFNWTKPLNIKKNWKFLDRLRVCAEIISVCAENHFVHVKETVSVLGKL